MRILRLNQHFQIIYLCAPVSVDAKHDLQIEHNFAISRTFHVVGRLDFEFYASEPDPEESWTQPKSATGPKVLRPNDFPGLCPSASHLPLETNLS